MNDQHDDTAAYETRSRGTAAGLFGIGGSILAAGQPLSVSFGSALGLGIGLTLLGIGAYYWFPRRLRCEGGSVKFPISRAIPLDPFTAFISVPATGEGYTQGPRIVLVPIEGGRQRTIQVRRYGFPDAAAVWLESRLRLELTPLRAESPEAQALLPRQKPKRKHGLMTRSIFSKPRDPEADRFVSDSRKASVVCVVLAALLVIGQRPWGAQPNGSSLAAVSVASAILLVLAYGFWLRDVHRCEDGILKLSRCNPIDLSRFIAFAFVPDGLPNNKIGPQLYLIPADGEQTHWAWCFRIGLDEEGEVWLRTMLLRSLEELWHHDDVVKTIIEHHNAAWTKDTRNLREHEGYVQIIPKNRERFVKPMLRALRYLTTFERRKGKADDGGD